MRRGVVVCVEAWYAQRRGMRRCVICAEARRGMCSGKVCVKVWYAHRCGMRTDAVCEER